MIGVINYGLGNIASVSHTVDYLGYDYDICLTPFGIHKYDRIILPGVGSFSSAMSILKRDGWVSAIEDFAASSKPLLGICLGMQLLFDIGNEPFVTPGLSLIPGNVQIMNVPDDLCLPHVGWNSLEFHRSHPILQGLNSNVDVYFVHSYCCNPSDRSCVLASTSYGQLIPAIVVSKNIVGMQFHPEKSQPSGLRLLQNFFEWDGISA